MAHGAEEDVPARRRPTVAANRSELDGGMRCDEVYESKAPKPVGSNGVGVKGSLAEAVAHAASHHASRIMPVSLSGSRAQSRVASPRASREPSPATPSLIQNAAEDARPRSRCV